MKKPMIFTETNEEGTDYAPDWAFEGGHEFVINGKPQHDKLRNGTVKQQLRQFGRVIICADGVIDGEEARIYLAIKPEHLPEVGESKPILSDRVGSLRKKYLKKAYKSLTIEDIEQLYNADTFHSLVLI